jgi:CTP:molybdopterin cytidylyltransferase MocA
MENIAGIILSAGASSRMGQPKALLPYKNTSILEHTISVQKEAGLNPIIVVLGAHIKPLDSISENMGAKVVYNKEWNLGQQSSLKAGLRAIPEEVNTIVVSLIDHPGVQSETINKLVSASLEMGDCIIQPLYKSKTGHPLILKGKIIDILRNSPIVDGGVKTIISENSDMIKQISVDDQAILMDIDTIEMYNKLLESEL